MINAEEILFVVDEDNQPVTPQARSIAHANKLWHRTVGIWVVNDQHQILCQRRSMKKDVKPGVWEAFFGGHMSPGEEYLTAAVKELGEELGLPFEEGQFVPYKVLKSDKPSHKEFQHIFALDLNHAAEELHFEEEEIDQIIWRDIEELRNLLIVDKDPDWVSKPWDKEVLDWIDTTFYADQSKKTLG